MGAHGLCCLQMTVKLSPSFIFGFQKLANGGTSALHERVHWGKLIFYILMGNKLGLKTRRNNGLGRIRTYKFICYVSKARLHSLQTRKIPSKYSIGPLEKPNQRVTPYGT